MNEENYAVKGVGYDKHFSIAIPYIAIVRDDKEERRFYSYVRFNYSPSTGSIDFKIQIPFDEVQAYDSFKFFELESRYKIKIGGKSDLSLFSKEVEGDWKLSDLDLNFHKDDFTTISSTFEKINVETELRYEEQKSKFLETVLNKLETTYEKLEDVGETANSYKEKYWRSLEERLNNK